MIVPARDDEALTEAMLNIAEKPALREKLGTAGKAYITEHFQANRTVADLDVAYRTVLSRNN